MTDQHVCGFPSTTLPKKELSIVQDNTGTHPFELPSQTTRACLMQWRIHVKQILVKSKSKAKENLSKNALIKVGSQSFVLFCGSPI